MQDLDEIPAPSKREDYNDLITFEPAPVWCGYVGEVEKGASGTLPAWTPLKFWHRATAQNRPNNVLVTYPGRGLTDDGVASFVDARHLAVLPTKQKAWSVPDSKLSGGYEAEGGCLNWDEAVRQCTDS